MSTRSYLGHETTLTEYTDPVRAELTVMGCGPISMEEGPTGHRWTFDIPGLSWYALRNHIRDTDPVRAELKKSLDDALSQIERLSDERDEAVGKADLWKSLAERQDNTAPLRMELSAVKRERDELKRHTDYLRLQAEGLSARAADDDVDELKAVIVSQAREIARLRGDSE